MKTAIKATPVKAGKLAPGDLFSTVGPEYWDHTSFGDGASLAVGERVYIRTNAPTPADQADHEVFLIEVVREGEISPPGSGMDGLMKDVMGS